MKYSTTLCIIATLALCSSVLSATIYADNVAASYKLGQASDSSVCAYMGERSVYEAFSVDNSNSFADSYEEQYLQFRIRNNSYATSAVFTLLASVSAGEFQIWALSGLPKNCTNSITATLMGNFTESADSGAYADPPTNVRSWVRWDITSFYNAQICNGVTDFYIGVSARTPSSAIYMPPTLTSPSETVRKASIVVTPATSSDCGASTPNPTTPPQPTSDAELPTDPTTSVLNVNTDQDNRGVSNSGILVQPSFYLFALVATLFVQIFL